MAGGAGALYVPECEEVRVSAAVARRGHLNVLQHGTHGWKKRWLVCDHFDAFLTFLDFQGLMKASGSCVRSAVNEGFVIYLPQQSPPDRLYLIESHSSLIAGHHTFEGGLRYAITVRKSRYTVNKVTVA